jgi:SAM-dependent methyltransferase
MSSEMRFGFGENWENYVRRHFSEERVGIARRHLIDFLGVDSLQARTFLDVGCGSGLHSLAALQAGAARVVSFDFDPNSVRATNRLRAHSGNPPHWTVLQGSILDDAFLKQLAPADVVYSWGVLHHTGAMWQALDNTVPVVKPGGLLYVALYDYDIHVQPSPEFWLAVKQRYNRAGRLGKRRMELWYVWEFALYRRLTNVPALIRRIAGYKHSRGMAFYYDVVDWLGGWPMEFARRADVKDWAGKAGLEMITMKTGEANTEYLFRK